MFYSVTLGTISGVRFDSGPITSITKLENIYSYKKSIPPIERIDFLSKLIPNIKQTVVH